MNRRTFLKLLNTKAHVVIPGITNAKRFNAATQDGYILSSEEWMGVISDNMLHFDKKPKQKSPYKIQELKFVEVKR